MIGMPTSCKPIRGAMAKEMHEHLEKISRERTRGTIKRAQAQHKTSIKLLEVTNG